MARLSHRERTLSELAGAVLVLIDLWRRLPRPVRRRIVGLARAHGPRLARRVLAARREER